MGQPRPLFPLFSSYSHQQDSNSDRWSRRRGRWPLDHHHGPKKDMWLLLPISTLEFQRSVNLRQKCPIFLNNLKFSDWSNLSSLTKKWLSWSHFWFLIFTIKVFGFFHFNFMLYLLLIEWWSKTGWTPVRVKSLRRLYHLIKFIWVIYSICNFYIYLWYSIA